MHERLFYWPRGEAKSNGEEEEAVMDGIVHKVDTVHQVQAAPSPYSFLSRYKFPSASSDVPTMSRNEMELMTGVEPSRTCR